MEYRITHYSQRDLIERLFIVADSLDEVEHRCVDSFTPRGKADEVIVARVADDEIIATCHVVAGSWKLEEL